MQARYRILFIAACGKSKVKIIRQSEPYRNTVTNYRCKVLSENGISSLHREQSLAVKSSPENSFIVHWYRARSGSAAVPKHQRGHLQTICVPPD